MKSPEYVRDVVRIWRRLLDEGRDASPADMRELAKIFSRGGFTDGYYKKRIGSDMLGVRSDSDKRESAAAEKFEKLERRLPIELYASIKSGREAELRAVSGERSATVKGAVPEAAINAPLTREAVDCIVFWTKNPAPMLPYLPEIARMGYPCLFQVTLNAYGPDVERALPPLHARVETVRTLAGLLGPERVTWRYDPILLSADYTADWHVRQFAALAQALEGCTVRCVISFLDVYDKIRRRLR